MRVCGEAYAGHHLDERAVEVVEVHGPDFAGAAGDGNVSGNIPAGLRVRVVVLAERVQHGLVPSLLTRYLRPGPSVCAEMVCGVLMNE